ncbi:hypothetical protein ABH931_006731 [Streptacidiphilus sp. MAP12-33]|uniref:ScbA/BarX family gamma-butyrolactone biosynthesis protein n=1 Tax=Streptacidiphilus sp. MAP12-33 TaxID=3156266 RepID=UPI003517D290
MTLTELRPDPLTSAGPLDFSRPVERALVHRAAVLEVFVTDCRPGDADRWRVAAQLPRAHAYFNDQAADAGRTDPLLLLECVRQAVTVVAHRHLGVPLGTSFLISTWQTRLRRPDLLTASAEAPDELELVITARDLRHRGATLLAATFDVELRRDGEVAGSSTVTAGYLSADGYLGYRRARRGTEPPSSADMPRLPRGVRPSPGEVGRARPENVMLTDLRHAEGRLAALVEAPVAHPSLYDHPLDHVPAMALLEAARQAALAVVGTAPGTAPGAARGYVSGLDAEFHQFVELDADVELAAAPAVQVADDLPGAVPVEVSVRQRGVDMCRVRVQVVGSSER